MCDENCTTPFSCTIQNEYGTYSAMVDGHAEWPLYKVLEQVVIPALRGAGYTDSVIAQHIDDNKGGFGHGCRD